MFQSPHTFFSCLDNNSAQPRQKVPYLPFPSKGRNGSERRKSWGRQAAELELEHRAGFPATHHPTRETTAQVAVPLWVSIFSHPLRVLGRPGRLGGQQKRSEWVPEAHQAGCACHLGTECAGLIHL